MARTRDGLISKPEGAFADSGKAGWPRELNFSKYGFRVTFDQETGRPQWHSTEHGVTLADIPKALLNSATLTVALPYFIKQAISAQRDMRQSDGNTLHFQLKMLAETANNDLPIHRHSLHSHTKLDDAFLDVTRHFDHDGIMLLLNSPYLTIQQKTEHLRYLLESERTHATIQDETWRMDALFHVVFTHPAIREVQHWMQPIAASVDDTMVGYPGMREIVTLLTIAVAAPLFSHQPFDQEFAKYVWQAHEEFGGLRNMMELVTRAMAQDGVFRRTAWADTQLGIMVPVQNHRNHDGYQSYASQSSVRHFYQQHALTSSVHDQHEKDPATYLVSVSANDALSAKWMASGQRQLIENLLNGHPGWGIDGIANGNYQIYSYHLFDPLWWNGPSSLEFCRLRYDLTKGGMIGAASLLQHASLSPQETREIMVDQPESLMHASALHWASKLLDLPKEMPNFFGLQEMLAADDMLVLDQARINELYLRYMNVVDSKGASITRDVQRGFLYALLGIEDPNLQPPGVPINLIPNGVKVALRSDDGHLLFRPQDMGLHIDWEQGFQHDKTGSGYVNFDALVTLPDNPTTEQIEAKNQLCEYLVHYFATAMEMSGGKDITLDDGKTVVSARPVTIELAGADRPDYRTDERGRQQWDSFLDCWGTGTHISIENKTDKVRTTYIPEGPGKNDFNEARRDQWRPSSHPAQMGIHLIEEIPSKMTKFKPIKADDGRILRFEADKDVAVWLEHAPISVVYFLSEQLGQTYKNIPGYDGQPMTAQTIMQDLIKQQKLMAVQQMEQHGYQGKRHAEWADIVRQSHAQTVTFSDQAYAYDTQSANGQEPLTAIAAGRDPRITLQLAPLMLELQQKLVASARIDKLMQWVSNDHVPDLDAGETQHVSHVIRRIAQEYMIDNESEQHDFTPAIIELLVQNAFYIGGADVEPFEPRIIFDPNMLPEGWREYFPTFEDSLNLTLHQYGIKHHFYGVTPAFNIPSTDGYVDAEMGYMGEGRDGLGSRILETVKATSPKDQAKAMVEMLLETVEGQKLLGNINLIDTLQHAGYTEEEAVAYWREIGGKNLMRNPRLDRIDGTPGYKDRLKREFPAFTAIQEMLNGIMDVWREAKHTGDQALLNSVNEELRKSRDIRQTVESFTVLPTAEAIHLYQRWMESDPDHLHEQERARGVNPEYFIMLQHYFHTELMPRIEKGDVTPRQALEVMEYALHDKDFYAGLLLRETPGERGLPKYTLLAREVSTALRYVQQELIPDDVQPLTLGRERLAQHQATEERLQQWITGERVEAFRSQEADTATAPFYEQLQTYLQEVMMPMVQQAELSPQQALILLEHCANNQDLLAAIQQPDQTIDASTLIGNHLQQLYTALGLKTQQTMTHH